MDLEQPIGYAPSTVQQRTDWNGFLDHVGQQDSPDLSTALSAYKKINPKLSITPDDIQKIQYEQHQIRNGNSFGSLNQNQLKYIRQGLPDSYINKPIGEINGKLTPETTKLYYPKTSSHGTDIEGYTSFKSGLAPINKGGSIDPSKAAGPAPATVAAPIKASPLSAPEESGDIIPKPDYNDQASRNTYLKNWAAKYGNLEGRGDTILKVNEVPRTGNDTAKNIAQKAAGKFGIDPALLYTSFMEEGGSGLFKDKKTGIDTKHRKPTDFGYQDDYGDKDYPINGGQSFGFQTFSERFPDLVKAGYLPKEFAKNFRGKANEGQFSANNFKDVQSAMVAKAALMKYNYDYVDKLAAKKGIQLSPKAKDFFALAAYNGGEGAVLKRLAKYKEAGLLDNDKFLKQRPEMEKNIPDNLDVYGHIVPRIKRRDALKEQKHFD